MGDVVTIHDWEIMQVHLLKWHFLGYLIDFVFFFGFICESFVVVIQIYCAKCNHTFHEKSFSICILLMNTFFVYYYFIIIFNLIKKIFLM